MVKILVIGDPHGACTRKFSSVIKKADLILLTGDLGKSDLMRKMAFEAIRRKKQGFPEKEYSRVIKKKAFMEAYNSSIKFVKFLSRKTKVFVIFGNVESSNKETRELSKEIGLNLPFLFNDLNSIKNVRVLNNRVAKFKGLRIGGLKYFLDTSWVKEFKPSDYKKRFSEAKKETEKARNTLNWMGELDVLVCHQPPYGVLDKVSFKGAPKHWIGKNAGSKVILSYIKKNSPKYVFCGHIHEGKGKRKLGKTEVYNVGSFGDYVFLDIN
jgi:Icc-related predicted phosphoesterase